MGLGNYIRSYYVGMTSVSIHPKRIINALMRRKEVPQGKLYDLELYFTRLSSNQDWILNAIVVENQLQMLKRNGYDVSKHKERFLDYLTENGKAEQYFEKRQVNQPSKRKFLIQPGDLEKLIS